MTYALAIDVGTTFTAAAVWRDGRADAVSLGTRSVAVPSVLFLRDDGVMLVGEAAEARSVTEPGRVAREFKRRFGDDVPMLLGDTQVTPTDLFADMIRFVVAKVREREAGPPAYVLLTCPATWSDYRRGLVEKAAGLAGLGLGEVGLLDEPTAAATYYAAQERLDPGDLLAVYDLGGGTFDATVLRKTPGGFEPLGQPGGDDEIGGVDLDQVVLDQVARAVGPAWYDLDTADPATARALAAVHAAAVSAKEALSSDARAEIPVILPGLNTVVRVGRDDLEDAARVLVLRSVDALVRTVRAAGVEPSTLRRVLLVGGSSRIPLVARTVEAALGVPTAVDTHPKLATCLGAAIAAASRLSPGAPSARPGRVPVPAQPVAPGTPPAQARAGDPAPGTAGAPRQARADPRREPHPGERAPGEPDAAALWAARAHPSTDGADPGSTTGTGHGATPADLHAQRAADLLVGARAPEPAVSVTVDRAAAGLTAPADQPLRPAATAPRTARLSDDDVPLQGSTGGAEYRRSGRRAAVATVAAAAGAALVIGGVVTALTLMSGSPPQASAPGNTPPSGGATTVSTARFAALAGGPIQDEAGVAHAVAARPGGGLVAVGAAGTDAAGRVPVAWWSPDGASWRRAGALPLPAGLTTGAVSGVAVAGDRLVAVGWATAGTARDALAWTSADGQRWQAATVEHPAAAVLRDVVAAPGGGLLAVGQGFAVDSEGDGAVWTSNDGTDWRKVPVSGVDGLGTQSLDRVTTLAGGGLLAVGQEPSGAGTAAHIRHSTDGLTWTTVDTDLPPDAEVTGLARLPDNRVVAVGSLVSGGARQPVVWVATPTADRWEAEAARGADRAATLLGATADGSAVSVSGGTDPGRPRPARWSVVLDQGR